MCRRPAHSRCCGLMGRRRSMYRLLSPQEMLLRLVLRLCLGSDSSPCQWDCDMGICIQGVSWEVLDGRKRLRGKLAAMHLQEASADPMGGSGVKMALQSCTGLRPGARPLHQQSWGTGCPWVGAKSWVSQTRAIPKGELSYEPSQQWDGAQLPTSSGSKFDHTSKSPGMLVKASRAHPHTQSFWFSKLGVEEKDNLKNCSSENFPADIADPPSPESLPSHQRWGLRSLALFSTHYPLWASCVNLPSQQQACARNP